MNFSWTISSWRYVPASQVWQFSSWRDASYQAIWFFNDYWYNRLRFTQYAYDLDVSFSQSNVWVNAITTYDYSGSNWKVSLYINWWLATSANPSKYSIPNTSSYRTLHIWWRWSSDTHYQGNWISEFIVEDKVRTAQEISDYYDLTKWDYWL